MITFNSTKATDEYRNATLNIAKTIATQHGLDIENVDLNFDVTGETTGKQNSPVQIVNKGIANGITVLFDHSHPIYTAIKFDSDGNYVSHKQAKKNTDYIVGAIKFGMVMASIPKQDRFYVEHAYGNGKITTKAEKTLKEFGLKRGENRRGFIVVDDLSDITKKHAKDIDVIRGLKLSDDFAPRAPQSNEAKPKNIKVICQTDEDCSFMNAVKSFVLENGKVSEIKDYYCPQGHLLIDATTKTKTDVVDEATEVLQNA